MSIEAKIIDRGRGPEIAGTRITVYNVLDYIEEGWHPARIALFFSISTDQVRAAIDYIAMHRDEVMPEYWEMLARDARGNPPELRAKLEASRAVNVGALPSIARIEVLGYGRSLIWPISHRCNPPAIGTR